MNKQSDFLPILIERYGSKRMRQIAEMCLVAPLIVTMIVTDLYLMVWRTNPLVHFIHMIWVLGLWMVGTITMFAFIIPMRLKLGKPFWALILSAIAISFAIYFTPLSRFTTMFPRQADLRLPALVGVLNLTICWFVPLRFRKKLIETQTH